MQTCTVEKETQKSAHNFQSYRHFLMRQSTRDSLSAPLNASVTFSARYVPLLRFEVGSGSAAATQVWLGQRLRSDQHFLIVVLRPRLYTLVELWVSDGLVSVLISSLLLEACTQLGL